MLEGGKKKQIAETDCLILKCLLSSAYYLRIVEVDWDMEIAVMGAGGLGGYFGSRLARGGNRVHFIARGNHLEALRKNGLRVITGEGEDPALKVSATDNPREIGNVELVLFCVKTYDTKAAARAILPVLGDNSAILTLQNGIDNYDEISAIVGEHRVIPGSALIVAGIESPGVIRVTTKLRKILLGEIDGAKTERVERINQVFLRAGIDSEVSSEIKKILWQKMVWICGMAGMTSATRLPIGDLLSNSETRQMFREVMEEVSAVAKSAGVDVGEDYAETRVNFAEQLEKNSVSSMLRDLNAGQRLELDALNGAIVRIGKERNVSTPMNRAIYAILKPYLNGAPK